MNSFALLNFKVDNDFHLIKTWNSFLNKYTYFNTSTLVDTYIHIDTHIHTYIHRYTLTYIKANLNIYLIEQI